MSNLQRDRLFHKTVEAIDFGPDCLSTGERLAAAVLLDRHDWLREMDYTMAEALRRIDDDSLQAIRELAPVFRRPHDYPELFGKN